MVRVDAFNKHSVTAYFMMNRSLELLPGAQDHMFGPQVDECHAVMFFKQI